MIRLFLKDFHLLDRIFSLYPRAEFTTLHSHTEPIQLHAGDKIHIDAVHFVTVTQYRKRVPVEPLVLRR